MSQPEPPVKKVMISSTSLDLPEHRKMAVEACLRQGFHPIAMEHKPARDAGPITIDEEMVEQADLYLGLYAWRYGEVPAGHDISYTEMEFNHAVARGLPILVFTIHKDHALTIDMIETGDVAQQRLAAFKQRACTGRIRREFKSAEDLRGEIIHALAEWKEQTRTGQEAPPSLHPPNIIPTAPKPYIAHAYSLLQTSQIIGRRDELKTLTDWVTKNEVVPASIRLLNVVAIGGMGKSALTWKWFNEIAPNELPDLHGRMWWSFYESDAYFENFVIRALAYTSGQTEAAVRALPPEEREDQLFTLLDERPFLLVLDGLERILLAYARMDAAHLADDDLDEQTANDIVRYYGLSDDVKETYLQKHRLRQCADPRAGRFLRRLTRVRASRLLISTRLYPAELQTNTALPMPGCHPLFLTGLSDDDALALWRAFIGGERSGTSERLLPYFNAFGNYPLLLRALAGEVAEYRPAPGDFDRWLHDHPDFNPAELDLRNAKTHVLHYALEGLNDAHRRTLWTLAAFRMPATWDTLCAVLIGETEQQPCRDQRALVAMLTELEDRGLVGWDKVANRYDLHPIVRGVVWAGLDGKAQQGVYEHLHTHFESLPMVGYWENVSRVDELTPAIELYYTLIGLKRFDDAWHLFEQRFDLEALERLTGNYLLVEMVESLFPQGVGDLPQLAKSRDQSWALNFLAIAYQFNGKPRLASDLFKRCALLDEQVDNLSDLAVGLSNFSESLRLSGSLWLAEKQARLALHNSRVVSNRSVEIYALRVLGVALAQRQCNQESKIALQRSVKVSEYVWSNAWSAAHTLPLTKVYLAECFVRCDEPLSAMELAQSSFDELTRIRRNRDSIYAARIQGIAALALGRSQQADRLLSLVLTQARTMTFVEEELPALIALAELRRRQNQSDEARELLDDVWDAAVRGPYPLFHADACNVLAQIERDAGNTAAAIEAATEAYRLAWCDGPPYAYHWGLVAAEQYLTALGAPLPVLPPFDPTKFEPMPEVEINPRDEFYVTENDL